MFIDKIKNMHLEVNGSLVGVAKNQATLFETIQLLTKEIDLVQESNTKYLQEIIDIQKELLKKIKECGYNKLQQDMHKEFSELRKDIYNIHRDNEIIGYKYDHLEGLREELPRRSDSLIPKNEKKKNEEQSKNKEIILI